MNFNLKPYAADLRRMNTLAKSTGDKVDLPPLQIPIKSWGNLVVESCLVMTTSITVAYNFIHRYSYLALSKISKLALVGYEYTSAYSPLRAFFMRNISMRSHLYGEAVEGHVRVCRFLVYLSTNPLQLCHPHLVVKGKAPKQTQGAH